MRNRTVILILGTAQFTLIAVWFAKALPAKPLSTEPAAAEPVLAGTATGTAVA